ncbi:MAG: peptidase domain-containing ABC transporter [Flavobacteriaceae bacterium]
MDNMSNNEPLPILKRFFRLLSLERKSIAQIIYYALFAGVVNLSLPLGIQAIVNFIQMGDYSTSWILLGILVVLGVIFVGVLQLMQLRITEDLQKKIFTRTSFDLAYRFPKMKWSALQGRYAPELANRFFETLTIQKGVTKILIDFSAALLQIIFGLILLSLYHPFFIAYGVVLLTLVVVIFKYSIPKGLETSLLESKYKYKVVHWIQDIARSLLSFKLSGKTTWAMDKSNVLIGSYLDAREKHFKVLVRQYLKMIGFKALVTAALLFIGGTLVINQQMNIGQFVAAEIIILLMINSVEKLILGLETFYDVLTSIEKLAQINDIELEDMGEHSLIQKDLGSTWQLKAHQIGFGFTENKLLSNISLTLEPGEKYYLYGTHGSGKSTLIQLLLGIINPQEGHISLQDRHLESIPRAQYHQGIGKVLARETLFEGTLRENISLMHPDISEEQIWEAIADCHLADLVNQWPNGLETPLQSEGLQMPGSVVRKILLARALVKKPKILVLEHFLEVFQKEEAAYFKDFLTRKEASWTLLMVGQNKPEKGYWNKVWHIEEGTINEEQ